MRVSPATSRLPRSYTGQHPTQRSHRVARAIIEAIHADEPPLRLALGAVDALEQFSIPGANDDWSSS